MIRGFDWVFDFGKHEGKTIDQVFGEAPGYLAWCLREVKGFEMTNKDKFLIHLNEEQGFHIEYDPNSGQVTRYDYPEEGPDEGDALNIY